MSQLTHKMSQVTRIQKPDLILFGGAFDPPHLGHTESLIFARESFPDSELCVVPSFQTPVSRYKIKQTSASFEDRMEMCKIAFSTLKPELSVLDVEKYLKIPSFTVQTLEYFKKQKPKQNLGLMIGLDQLRTFHTWLEPLRILQLASLVIIPRENLGADLALEEFANKLRLKLHQKDAQGVLLEAPYLPLFFLSRTPVGLSSTDIREKLFQGENLSSFLSSDLIAHIYRKKLYANRA